VYAIGGNEVAARYAGIPVGRVKMIVYAVMGALAGLSACVYLGYLGAAETNAGTGYELKVIAAAVIGGANLAGGIGTAFGAVIGALLIEIIRNSLILLGISTFWQGTFIGSFIVIAVTFDRLRRTP
jgi:ribose transport system permease protein